MEPNQELFHHNLLPTTTRSGCFHLWIQFFRGFGWQPLTEASAQKKTYPVGGDQLATEELIRWWSSLEKKTSGDLVQPIRLSNRRTSGLTFWLTLVYNQGIHYALTVTIWTRKPVYCPTRLTSASASWICTAENPDQLLRYYGQSVQ